MKKLFLAVLISLFFFLVGTALAFDWVTTNQATVRWDHVTTLENGDPIPDLSQRYYMFYIANAITDPGKANPTTMGETDANEYTITLNIEGRYYVGVDCLRKIDGEVVGRSMAAWSDDPIYVQNGQIFGIQYFLKFGIPGGLRPQ